MEIEIGLDRLNFCSVQTEFRIAPPVTVLPGPASQCPAATLPRSPLSLPHLTADTGPPTRPTPLVSHITLRRPRPAALPCSATATSPTPDGRGPLPVVFHCLMLPTDAPGPLSLSHFPPSTRHRPRTPPPILSSSPFPLWLEKSPSAPPPSSTRATASPCKSTPDCFLSTGEPVQSILSTKALAPHRILGHNYHYPPLG
jgi:hypothetical protein